MERKYQVFISSTFEDLKDERKEVIQTLLEMDCIPTGMEMFQASDDSQWELIKSVISSCDYYIVIIAGRYGSVHPITQKSYTQMEYEYASEIEIPIIAFLYEDIDNLPNNKIEKNKKNQKKLQQFRELTKKRMVKFWSNKSELASAVSRSLYNIFKTHPRNGWVRSDVNKNITSSNDTIINTVNETKELVEALLKKEKYIQSNENLNNEKEIVDIQSIFWEKYNFYKECIENVKYKTTINYELTLGSFHIDLLKEIVHIIFAAGFCSLATFFDFTLKLGFVKVSFCSDIKEFKKIIHYNENSYFSEFNCITPGYIYINFYDGIINKINTLYEIYNVSDMKNKDFLKSAMHELGSIFVGSTLTSLAYILNQSIILSNYKLNNNILESVFSNNNIQYLICELPDNNTTEHNFIKAYFILDVKYIKILFELYNLFI